MFTNKNNIILFIILFLIIIIIYNILNKKSFNDGFVIIPGRVNLNDPNNDGKLSFNFLRDSNHTSNLLNKYYLNDDLKNKGIRNETHMYQKYMNGKYGIL